MKRKTLGIAAGALLAVVLVIMAGLASYIHSTGFMTKAGSMAAETASEALGLPVEIGEIEAEGLRSITIKDITVYDKQAEQLAWADSAQVSFSLLSVLGGSPAGAVNEVIVDGVRGTIIQRADGSWNINDVEINDDKRSSFKGKVIINRAELTARLQQGSVTFTDIDTEFNFDHSPVGVFKSSARAGAGVFTATGSISSSSKIVSATADNLNIADYLHLVPAGLIPNEITVQGGVVNRVKANATYRDGQLEYSGQLELADGRARIMDTQVENIHGMVSLDNNEAVLLGSAEAAGQKANCTGRIILDTDSPTFDLNVSTDSFDPSKILVTLPCSGDVKAKARVTGTVGRPIIDGDITATSVKAYGYTVDSATFHARYADDFLYVTDLQAKALGGSVTGEGELYVPDLQYNAHLKPENIDVAAVAANFDELAGRTSGRVSGDIGATGITNDSSSLQLYGSVSGRDMNCLNVPIDSLDASFYTHGQNITIDIASLAFPNRGTLGVEGTIMDGHKLDLAFYGGHMDLSYLKNFAEQVDASGFADFKGEVHGDADNPFIKLDMSANNGSLWGNPFDSLLAKVGGGADGIGIKEFFTEYNGAKNWEAKGIIGLTGEKRIDLSLTTYKARVEPIVSLLAPDIALTGNFDNTVKINGTMDDPQLIGHIHFYRGSLNGVLVSTVDADYKTENGLTTVSNGHLTSPWLDVDMEGTLAQDGSLDMKVAMNDINAERFQSYAPYKLEGHGTFIGNLTGTGSNPVFDGILDYPLLTLNGQALDTLHGRVHYADREISVERFGFFIGNGSWDMEVSYNLDSEAIAGDMVLQDSEINQLCSILNQKNDKLNGELNCQITLSGTLDNPSMNTQGQLIKGKLYGYDIHGVDFDGRLLDHVLYIKSLHGNQGERGTFFGEGYIALDGPVDATLEANDLEAGIFTAIAGVQEEFTGALDIKAEFGGTTKNPAADMYIHSDDGGFNRSSYDTLDAELHLKNGLLSIDKLIAEKTMGKETYNVHAEGVIGLSSILDGSVSGITPVNLRIYLDDANLAVLPALSKYIEWAIGPTDGTITVTGTTANPVFNGSVSIPEGTVKIKGLNKPITDVNLQINCEDGAIVVEQCSGTLGKGSYDLKGHFTLDGLTLTDYAADFHADQLEIDCDFFKGPVTADFSLTEHEAVNEAFGYRQRLPKLAGRLYLEHDLVSIPTIPDSKGDMPNILLDVDVELGPKVHLYSPYLFDMNLVGKAHFGWSTKFPRTSGSIKVRKGGTINYLKSNFDIVEGELKFDQEGSMMPSINLFAYTKIDTTRVYLTAKGPIGNMNFKLRSTPEMSTTEITKLLALRSNYKNGKGLTAGDLAGAALSMVVMGEIENMVRNTLHVDQFSVSQGTASIMKRKRKDSTKKYYNISVGKNISDRISLKYIQGVGADTNNSFGVQYEVNEHLDVAVIRDSGDYIYGFMGSFKF